jgi:hypothetical protein
MVKTDGRHTTQQPLKNASVLKTNEQKKHGRNRRTSFFAAIAFFDLSY